jgi:hypothetical protein
MSARPTPLFLLSLPRSGSTLAQRILAAHGGIATTSEPWILLPYLYVRTSYRRVGSDVGRGCWGLLRDLSEPKILRQKLQKLPAWNRIHVHK